MVREWDKREGLEIKLRELGKSVMRKWGERVR